MECKWGFHYRQFVPREVIVTYRHSASSVNPELLNSNKLDMSTVQAFIKRAGLDTNLFKLITPIYSGRFDDDGNIHLFKGETPLLRNGDIQIAPAFVEHFMKTVVHNDWKQEMSTNEFQFERANLVGLSSEMPYTTYGG